MSINRDFSGKRIFVAGHRGMVGSALVRALNTHENVTILTADRQTLDLVRQADTEAWFETHRPDVVIDAAATAGGIWANSNYPVDFLYNNLMIQCNLINAAFRVGVERLLFLGSSCIYPRMAPQPIEEDSLLTGALEPTNEWYAIAKISGVKLTTAYRRQYGADFISAMPTNLYGPNDNFDLKTSHVLPALLRKMHEAKVEGRDHVEIWGSGTPLREFMHVDDLADACLFLLQRYEGEEHINVGTGEEVSIKDLAGVIRDQVGFGGKLVFNSEYPDGTPRKLLDSSRIRNMGWRPSITLEEGVATTYRWFLDHCDLARERMADLTLVPGE